MTSYTVAEQEVDPQVSTITPTYCQIEFKLDAFTSRI